MVMKNGIELDNVMPHSVDLLVKCGDHINVEICSQTKAIKYWFKYINKGPDRAKAILKAKSSIAIQNNLSQDAEVDKLEHT